MCFICYVCFWIAQRILCIMKLMAISLINALSSAGSRPLIPALFRHPCDTSNQHPCSLYIIITPLSRDNNFCVREQRHLRASQSWTVHSDLVAKQIILYVISKASLIALHLVWCLLALMPCERRNQQNCEHYTQFLVVEWNGTESHIHIINARNKFKLDKDIGEVFHWDWYYIDINTTHTHIHTNILPISLWTIFTLAMLSASLTYSPSLPRIRTDIQHRLSVWISCAYVCCTWSYK